MDVLGQTVTVKVYLPLGSSRWKPVGVYITTPKNTRRLVNLTTLDWGQEANGGKYFLTYAYTPAATEGYAGLHQLDFIQGDAATNGKIHATVLLNFILPDDRTIDIHL